MGGELEKSTLAQKTNVKLDSKSPNKNNHKNKLPPLATEENNTLNKKNAKSAMKTLNNINEAKRDKQKKKKEKISVVSKDKDDKNQEKKVLELIHEKNAEKEDYELIHDIISKHFFYKH